MNRKKVKCICGLETRIDYLKKHKTTCSKVLQNVIDELISENMKLKQKNETLEQLFSKNPIVPYSSEAPTQITNITNNIQINNIIVYGEETPPKLLHELTELCRKGRFDMCCAAYIEKKHFHCGIGNIRILNNKDSNMFVMQKNNNGEKNWVQICKDPELNKITVDANDDIICRYGTKPVINMYETWSRINDIHDIHSKEFKSIRRKIEEVIIQNSTPL